MCFDGFDLSDGILCYFHLICTLRIVSPMYVFPQVQASLEILQAGWIHGSLSFKRIFIFLVSHFILMPYLSLVNLLNFLTNCLEATSFLSQYGISMKITGGLTSKNPRGMIKSMFW